MQAPSSTPAAEYFRAFFSVLRFAGLLLVGLLLIFFSLTGKAGNGSLSQSLSPQTTMVLGTALGVLLVAVAVHFLQRALRRFIDLRRQLQLAKER